MEQRNLKPITITGLLILIASTLMQAMLNSKGRHRHKDTNGHGRLMFTTGHYALDELTCVQAGLWDIPDCHYTETIKTYSVPGSGTSEYPFSTITFQMGDNTAYDTTRYNDIE